MSLARAYAGDSAVNMMTVGGTQQVMLKVKVAEINRQAGKDLGVSFAAIGTEQHECQAADRHRREQPGHAPTTTATRSSRTSYLRCGSFAGVFGAIFTIADSFILDLRIDALEAKGFAKILSEPNLTSLSGIEASFLAGGEVPIPVQGDLGQVTVSFKPVGVSLNFLPLVLDNDMINVSVSAEVSQVDPEHLDRHERHRGHRLPDPPRDDDGRAARRPGVRHRRPAAGELRGFDQPGAVAGRHPGPRARSSARSTTSAARPSW